MESSSQDLTKTAMILVAMATEQQQQQQQRRRRQSVVLQPIAARRGRVRRCDWSQRCRHRWRHAWFGCGDCGGGVCLFTWLAVAAAWYSIPSPSLRRCSLRGEFRFRSTGRDPSWQNSTEYRRRRIACSTFPRTYSLRVRFVAVSARLVYFMFYFM